MTNKECDSGSSVCALTPTQMLRIARKPLSLGLVPQILILKALPDEHWKGGGTVNRIWCIIAELVIEG